MTDHPEPHPALAMGRAMAKSMGPRDRLGSPPPAADDAEGAFLLSLRTGFHAHQWDSRFNTLTVRGKPVGEKLAALRCRWWGWAMGHGLSCGPLTAPGNEILGDWLRRREAEGDKEAAAHRRRMFPTAEEAAERRRRQDAAARKADVDHRRHDLRQVYYDRVERQDRAARRLEAAMLAVAHKLADGANDVDALLAELKHLKRRVSEALARRAEAAAMAGAVDSLPDAEVPSVQDIGRMLGEPDDEGAEG